MLIDVTANNKTWLPICKQQYDKGLINSLFETISQSSQNNIMKNHVKSNDPMKVPNRPPTARMIKKLKECLERSEQAPFLADNMKSSLPGLYKRGLVETRMELVNDKKLLCIYVSELGKKFLSNESEN